MVRPRRVCSAICLCLLLGVIAGAQTTQPAVPAISLSVSGEVERPLKLTAADLAKLPHRSIRAKGHDGKEAEFEGVPLVEVLKLAGMKFGEHLRRRLSRGLRAAGTRPGLYRQGYPSRGQTRRQADGRKEGPLRIVVPDEKRQARWVRQVTGLVTKRSS